MSKKMRNLKFLNKQVIAVRSGGLPVGMHEDAALLLLCSVSPCSGWMCEECPVRREAYKIEEEKNGKP